MCTDSSFTLPFLYDRSTTIKVITPSSKNVLASWLVPWYCTWIWQFTLVGLCLFTELLDLFYKCSGRLTCCGFCADPMESTALVPGESVYVRWEYQGCRRGIMRPVCQGGLRVECNLFAMEFSCWKTGSSPGSVGASSPPELKEELAFEKEVCCQAKWLPWGPRAAALTGRGPQMHPLVPGLSFPTPREQKSKGEEESNLARWGGCRTSRCLPSCGYLRNCSRRMGPWATWRCGCAAQWIGSQPPHGMSYNSFLSDVLLFCSGFSQYHAFITGYFK